MSEENQTLLAEEAQAKALNELLTAMEKAKTIAQWIREKTVGIPFTITKLSQLTRISDKEANDKVNFISQYGLLDMKLTGGVQYFQIVLDPQKRIDAMQSLKLQIQQRLMGQISFITQMQEIVSQELQETKLEIVN